jgi:hypothetical protein
MRNFSARNGKGRHYQVLLLALTLLFAGRVGGQLLVANAEVDFLPPFERWASGLVPYPLLVIFQFFLLIVMFAIVRDFARRSGVFVSLRLRTGKILIAFSVLYALAMILRYIVTMILHPELRWFIGTIPIWFHFVLAAFIYLLGRFTIENNAREELHDAA